jgi:hypothetical protein
MLKAVILITILFVINKEQFVDSLKEWKEVEKEKETYLRAEKGTINQLYSYGKKMYKEDEEWASITFFPSLLRGVKFKVSSYVFLFSNFTEFIGYQSFYGVKLINVSGVNEEGMYHYKMVEENNNNNFIIGYGIKTENNQLYFFNVTNSGGKYEGKKSIMLSKSMEFGSRHCFYHILLK